MVMRERRDGCHWGKQNVEPGKKLANGKRELSASLIRLQPLTMACCHAESAVRPREGSGSMSAPFDACGAR